MNPLSPRKKALFAAGLSTFLTLGAIQLPVSGIAAAATVDLKTAERTDLTDGHTDAFRIVATDDAVTPKVRNGLKNTEYEPESVTMVIDESCKLEEGDLMSFQPPGYWSLAFADSGVSMNPGWNVSYDKQKFSSMHIDFTKVSGPGRAALFMGSEDGESPERAVLKDGGYWIEKGSTLPVEGHSHPQWVFEKAGNYEFTAVATAVRKDGTELKSREFTIYFRVGDSDNVQPEKPREEKPKTEPTTGVSSTSELPSKTTELPVDDAGTHVERDRGHLDLFNVTPQGGSTALVIKDDTDKEPVLRDPADVTLRVGENAYRDNFGGALKDIAASGYFLSQNGDKQDEMLFPGWDTTASGFAGYGKTDFRFLEVKGPGEVHLAQLETLKGLKPVLKDILTGKETTALTSGTVLEQSFPAHAHAHWIFTKPGTYSMKVQASSYPKDGGDPVHSNVATYTWEVGEKGASQPKPQPEPKPSTQGSDAQGSSKTAGILAFIVALLGILGAGAAAWAGLIPGVKLR